MPRGGHNRKPTALKIAEGTFRADRANPNEPKPKPVAPKCPDWLAPEAKKEWRKLAPVLERLGILTEIDGNTLAAYCETVAQVKAASIALRDLPFEHPNYRKVAVTLEKARDAMRHLGAELGLSPASRGRLNVAEPEEEDDPMELILRRSDRAAAKGGE